jgi:hypothetical protein
MLELLVSLISGGATGIAGVALSAFVEHYKQKQKNEHELLILSKEQENMKLEIANGERLAVIESEKNMAIAADNLMAQSIAADKATYSTDVSGSKWAFMLILVDVVRGLTRPGLTFLLVLSTVLMYFFPPAATLTETQMKIAATVLYITTAAVLWWFGSRVKQAA